MSSSLANQSESSAASGASRSSGVSRRRRRRGPSLRRRLREQFPAYRVRRLIFFCFLGVATIVAGYMLGSYQPSSDGSSPAD